MTDTAHTPILWEKSSCCVPMWMGGTPSGYCGNEAYGPQLPMQILLQTRSRNDIPYCFGHCCPKHGGPSFGDPIIFQDGSTDEGRQMWCAVMPGFINLQESPAGFSGNPLEAIALLNAEINLAILAKAGEA